MTLKNLSCFGTKSPWISFSDRIGIVRTWNNLRRTLDLIEKELNEKTNELPSERMCRFLVLAEDRRFGQHCGFDSIALIRATYKVCFCNTRQGGSTIAMQLVRTLTRRYKRTLWRKFTEIILAVLLTRYIAEHRLPVIYLWCAYYGWRMNNFEQACSRLGIDPNLSTPKDDAEFVARLKYPQPQNPSFLRSSKISQRGRHILKLSVQNEICYQHLEWVETHV